MGMSALPLFLGEGMAKHKKGKGKGKKSLLKGGEVAGGKIATTNDNMKLQKELWSLVTL